MELFLGASIDARFLPAALPADLALGGGGLVSCWSSSSRSSRRAAAAAMEDLRVVRGLEVLVVVLLVAGLVATLEEGMGFGSLRLSAADGEEAVKS